MATRRNRMLVMFVMATSVFLHTSDRAESCGGLFCQLVPIDQAGEQIIFRQDGDMVTAIVLIQYAGDAADFSWVVPVPGIPELSTGSDLVFSPLEIATRPQFILETKGTPCNEFRGFGAFAPSNSVDSTGGSAEGDNGVEVLETLTVGPFDVQVVSSDDPAALATWLEDNNYDLSDRGQELITPYVEEGMNFVALRLQQDQGVGDLQPLIMRYVSSEPMIPIRLTAVAAQRDMGVIVWLLGDSRAVPLNYLHVIPNYTRLNWYAGTFNAYASYQGLITAAMNEAGGQGFATDYAGRSLDVATRLPSASMFSDELVRLSAIVRDAEMIAGSVNGFVFPQDQVLEILRRELPLPAGEGEFTYQIPELLEDLFAPDQLVSARTALVVELNSTIIDPLMETLAIFDGDPYMTRFYTTLSPEEMTLDPKFSFNPDLDDQPIYRNATLNLACNGFDTVWNLTLGSGTDREGDVVIEGVGAPPNFIRPVIDQDAVWRSETIGASGPPTVVTQKVFPTLQIIGDDATFPLCGVGTAQCGGGALGMLLLPMIGLRVLRRRH